MADGQGSSCSGDTARLEMIPLEEQNHYPQEWQKANVKHPSQKPPLQPAVQKEKAWAAKRKQLRQEISDDLHEPWLYVVESPHRHYPKNAPVTGYTPSAGYTHSRNDRVHLLVL